MTQFHPDYYKLNGIEVIDFINAYNINFSLGNVIKYVNRAGHKNNEAKITVFKKAEWYLSHEAVTAALTCHANTDKQVVNESLLTRIIKLGHESILEHINLTYSVKNISRACLLELSRHRHISLSVESTRETLKMKMEDDEFIYELLNSDNRFSLSEFVLASRIKTTLGLPFAVKKDYPELTNDELKYFLPECWPTNLILTTNVRELHHILDLRTALQALKEFRDLAREMFNTVPNEFKYLLQDCVHEEVSS